MGFLWENPHLQLGCRLQRCGKTTNHHFKVSSCSIFRQYLPTVNHLLVDRSNRGPSFGLSVWNFNCVLSIYLTDPFDGRNLNDGWNFLISSLSKNLTMWRNNTAERVILWFVDWFALHYELHISNRIFKYNTIIGSRISSILLILYKNKWGRLSSKKANKNICDSFNSICFST